MKKFLTLLMALFFSTIYSSYADTFAGSYATSCFFFNSDSSIVLSIYQKDSYSGAIHAVNIINTQTGEFIATIRPKDKTYFSLSEPQVFFLQKITLNIFKKRISINNRYYDFDGNLVVEPDYVDYDTLTARTVFSFNKISVKNILIEPLYAPSYFTISGMGGNNSLNGIDKIWDKSHSKLLNIIPEDFIVAHSDTPDLVPYISDDDNYVVIIDNWNYIGFYNVNTKKLKRYLLSESEQKMFSNSNTAGISFDKSIVTLTVKDAMYHYNLDTKQIIDSISFEANAIIPLSDERRYFILEFADGVKVYDDSVKAIVAEFASFDNLGMLRFSASNKVISVYRNYKVTQYNIDDSSIREFELPNLYQTYNNPLDLSKDGKYLLCLDNSPSSDCYSSWDIENDKLLCGVQHIQKVAGSCRYLKAPYSFFYSEELPNSSTGSELTTRFVNLLNGNLTTGKSSSYYLNHNEAGDKILEYFNSGEFNYYPVPDQAITSVQDIKSDGFNAEIYPNPANDKINLNGISEGNYTLRISNINGELMHSSNVLISGNSNFEFDIKSLPSGAYVLELKNSSQSYTGKFNKVK